MLVKNEHDPVTVSAAWDVYPILFLIIDSKTQKHQADYKILFIFTSRLSLFSYDENKQVKKYNKLLIHPTCKEFENIYNIKILLSSFISMKKQNTIDDNFYYRKCFTSRPSHNFEGFWTSMLVQNVDFLLKEFSRHMLICSMEVSGDTFGAKAALTVCVCIWFVVKKTTLFKYVMVRN